MFCRWRVILLFVLIYIGRVASENGTIILSTSTLKAVEGSQEMPNTAHTIKTTSISKVLNSSSEVFSTATNGSRAAIEVTATAQDGEISLTKDGTISHSSSVETRPVATDKSTQEYSSTRSLASENLVLGNSNTPVRTTKQPNKDSSSTNDEPSSYTLSVATRMLTTNKPIKENSSSPSGTAMLMDEGSSSTKSRTSSLPPSETTRSSGPNKPTRKISTTPTETSTMPHEGSSATQNGASSLPPSKTTRSSGPNKPTPKISTTPTETSTMPHEGSSATQNGTSSHPFSKTPGLLGRKEPSWKISTTSTETSTMQDEGSTSSHNGTFSLSRSVTTGSSATNKPTEENLTTPTGITYKKQTSSIQIDTTIPHARTQRSTKEDTTSRAQSKATGSEVTDSQTQKKATTLMGTATQQDQESSSKTNPQSEANGLVVADSQTQENSTTPLDTMLGEGSSQNWTNHPPSGVTGSSMTNLSTPHILTTPTENTLSNAVMSDKDEKIPIETTSSIENTEAKIVTVETDKTTVKNNDKSTAKNTDEIAVKTSETTLETSSENTIESTVETTLEPTSTIATETTSISSTTEPSTTVAVETTVETTAESTTTNATETTPIDSTTEPPTTATEETTVETTAEPTSTNATETTPISSTTEPPTTATTSTTQITTTTPLEIQKPDSNAIEIVSGILGVLLFAGLLATAAVMYRRGKLPWNPRNSNASVRPLPISLSKFETHCNELLETQGRLGSEFQLLQALSVDISDTNTFTAAQLPDNKKKNRYTNILPYDATRVILDVVNDDPSSDYINASFVKGFSNTYEYIASQGPKEETISDFWRMVHQHDVQVIVMVTNWEEGGKPKCDHYLPKLRDQIYSGDMVVRCGTELVFPVYTQRTIVLHKGPLKRNIAHLHFNEWPDFGCPDSTDSMLQFCRTLRHQVSLYPPGMVLVHCSAGVGRTGTLIAVDILLQQIQESKKVDVFGTVFKLRKHRTNMVQTKGQYEYIYKCIRDAVKDPTFLKSDGSPASSLEPIYENVPTTLTTFLYEKVPHKVAKSNSSESECEL